MKKKLPYIIVFVFGALLYANTVPNRYAYDDYSVVRDNRFTRQGIGGIPGHFLYDSFYGFTGQKNLFRGGRYRPLSLATFSIEYEFFGENPHVSHLVNMILYGLICMLLLKVFASLFGDKLAFKGYRDYFVSLSLMSVLVFAAHPVHTEVVANIKGRDELMALLFSLLAWNAVLKYAVSFRPVQAALAGIWFFLALMSKESAIPFLVMIPLSLYCFRPAGVFRKASWWPAAGLFAGFAVFILIRQTVVGWESKPSMPDNILSNAFMHADGFSERYGTTFLTLGLYLKLLVFPNTLTIDYYPFYIPYVGLGDWRSLVPMAVYTGLAAGALWYTWRRNPAGFGMLFFLVALLPVSNLLFVVGPFMGERFAFIPSAGFVLAAVWILLKITEKYRLTITLPFVFGAILILFSARTLSRNTEWKDDFTLYTTDVRTSKNSAIITRAAGQHLLIRLETEQDSARFREYAQLAVEYLEQAEKMNKSETETLLLGNAYFNVHDFDRAIGMYSETLKMNKDHVKAYGNYLVAVGMLPSPAAQIALYNQLLGIAGERFEPYYQKGLVYGKTLNNLDSSIANLTRAYRFDSVNTECLSSLGVAWAMKGDLRKSVFYLEKGYRINPSDKFIVNNLIVTLTNLGEKEQAQKLIREQQGRN